MSKASLPENDSFSERNNSFQFCLFLERTVSMFVQESNSIIKINLCAFEKEYRIKLAVNEIFCVPPPFDEHFKFPNLCVSIRFGLAMAVIRERVIDVVVREALLNGVRDFLLLFQR